jgi:hypothetical protein
MARLEAAVPISKLRKWAAMMDANHYIPNVVSWFMDRDDFMYLLDCAEEACIEKGYVMTLGDDDEV